MTAKNWRRVDYHSMVDLALVVGIFGIELQFQPGFELLSFMLSLAVLGGLIGRSNSYAARDRQQLVLSCRTAYEGLLLILLAAFAVIELSRWLPIEGVVILLNGHWPGLIVAMICVLMGTAGLQKRSVSAGPA